MDLLPYVAQLHRQLLLAAEAGGPEAREVAERLTAPLESTTRLLLLDALSEAAAQITENLAPGSVEVRLRGRDVDFAVTSPDQAAAQAGEIGETGGADAPAVEPARVGSVEEDGDDGGTARLSLRLPERLKPRVEQAADEAGMSVNAWLVRSVTQVLDEPRPIPPPRPTSPPRLMGERHSGWVR